VISSLHGTSLPNFERLELLMFRAEAANSYVMHLANATSHQFTAMAAGRSLPWCSLRCVCVCVCARTRAHARVRACVRVCVYMRLGDAKGARITLCVTLCVCDVNGASTIIFMLSTCTL